MPSYSFVAYDPSAITVSGGTLTLSAAFDPATDRTTITIDDDDAFFARDSVVDKAGNDSNQLSGGAATRIYAEERYVLTNGTEITRVESNGTLLGYILNGPALVPGTSYTITSTANVANADTDNADPYTALDDVPCCVAGTQILTPSGEVPVERLQPGDRVITLDHGAQPVRWVAQRTVLARGKFLPVEFKPGALGNDRPLFVSQQHRMLLSNPLAELYFGSHQVFAHALHLINHADVVAADHFKLVTFCQFAFDDHEIVFANGARAESLFLGDLESSGEMLPLQRKHSQTARVTLRHHETRMIAEMRTQPESEIAAAMCVNRLAV